MEGNMNLKTYVRYNGKNHALIDLIYEKGLIQHTAAIRRRIQRGWSAQKAIDTPINKGRYFRLISTNEEYVAKYADRLRKTA